MQTAYVIHMSEGPSIRKIVETTARPPYDGQEGTPLEIAVTEYDDKWEAKGNPVVLRSTTKRKPWGWINRLLNQSTDDETLYHENLRRQLNAQYNWRFELYPALSDAL